MPPFVKKAPYRPVSPPLKWHGGKHYLTEWIISLMPPRGDSDGYLHYVEPYFGGGSVLLQNDPEGISEVANDLNGGLTDFWRTLQSTEGFNQFKRLVDAIPFSQAEYDEATVNSILRADGYGETVHRAATFFVRCRQSYAGRMKEFTAVTKTRVRRGMNAEVSAWLSCVEGLPEVHARMRRVLILNRPALEVIRSQDGPRTLFYLDPTTGEYEHEMTEGEHAALLNALVSSRESGGSLQGRFLLSGYRSDLYDSYAARFGWRRHEKAIHNHAAGGKKKRIMTECVWTNY